MVTIRRDPVVGGGGWRGLVEKGGGGVHYYRHPVISYNYQVLAMTAGVCRHAVAVHVRHGGGTRTGKLEIPIAQAQPIRTLFVVKLLRLRTGGLVMPLLSVTRIMT